MRRRNVVLGVAGVLVLAVGVFAVGQWRGWFVSPSVRGAPAVEAPVRVLVTGLAAPWGLAFRPGGSALVAERGAGKNLAVTPGGRGREVPRVPGGRPLG